MGVKKINLVPIQDSLTVSRMFLSNTSLDSFFFLNQDDDDFIISDDQFNELLTKMGKNEQGVIQEAIRLKQLWKEEDVALTENFIAYQFMTG